MHHQYTARGRRDVVLNQNWTGSQSGDPEMVARLTELRDRFQYIADAKETVAYKFAKWIRGAVLGIAEDARYLRDHKIAITKASGENINEAGGVVVPEELADEILTLRDLYGVIARNARTWPLKFGATANVPRRSAGAAAQWVSENSAISKTAITTDSVGLNMKKLAAMIICSTEFEEDALAAFGAFLIEEFAYAVAIAEDNAGFSGDGTSTYAGISGLSKKLTTQGTAGKISASSGTYASLTGADVGALIGALPARAVPNAKLFISQAGYGNALVRLAATGGGLVAHVGPDGSLNANFHGLPVELTPSLPSSTSSLTSGTMMMAAGDMTQGIARGERRQITVRRLSERFADLDQVAFMATERVDINVHDVGSASTTGAMVGLFAP